jgi:hypothetical protein
MPLKTNPVARQRAEAAFKARLQQQVDGPKAVREYREKQRAALDQMQKLRGQRLARERATRARGRA